MSYKGRGWNEAEIEEAGCTERQPHAMEKVQTISITVLPAE
jgi:hypothetical protein